MFSPVDLKMAWWIVLSKLNYSLRVYANRKSGSLIYGGFDVTLNNRTEISNVMYNFTRGQESVRANRSNLKKYFNLKTKSLVLDLDHLHHSNHIFISEALGETEPKNDRNCTSQCWSHHYLGSFFKSLFFIVPYSKEALQNSANGYVC